MVVVPIDIYPIGSGFHMKVDILINRKPASLIVDTGASRTVFDERRLFNFNVGELRNNGAISAGAGSEEIEQKDVIIKIFRIGDGISIKDFEGVAMDLSHINQHYEDFGLPPVDGVLGGDILMAHNASIDYLKKEMILHDLF